MKEADTLAGIGLKVTVVGSQHDSWVVDWDRQLMKRKSWRYVPVRWDRSLLRPILTRAYTGTRYHIFRKMFKSGISFNEIAKLAYCRLYHELLKQALQTKPNLFIAHNPQALPVACDAAESLGALVAFDSEDFHSGEFSGSARQSLEARLVGFLEHRYLSKCRYVTTSSEEIAKALERRYGIKKPTPIHNVFPWRDRQLLDGQIKDRSGPELSLYWFSQIIGLDRGLQDVIKAIGILSKPVQIHLRGDISENTKNELLKLAKSASVRQQLHFHAPVPPEALLSRVAEHDIGLALEQPVNPNRQLTVTNKFFFYLLAGISIAATDTEGQRSIMQTCPEAGFLYPPGDYQALAKGLQELIDSPDLLKRRKKAALKAAEEKWNWEIEEKKLVALIKTCLES